MPRVSIHPDGPDAYALYVDETYVDTAPSYAAAEAQAERLRDRVVTPQTTPAPTTAPDADLPSDPLTLFAGRPRRQPIPTTTALARALAHFRSHYSVHDREHKPLLDAATRAFAALTERSWRVTELGTLILDGSTGARYRVTDAECRRVGTHDDDGLCPSFRYQQRRHGGQCYHMIARELIRLAQYFSATDPALVPDDPAPPRAEVTVGGRELGLACAIAHLAEVAITVVVSETTVVVRTTNTTHAVRLAGVDGHGYALLTLDQNAFAALWAAYRPRATRTPQARLCIDPTTATLTITTASDQPICAHGQIVREA